MPARGRRSASVGGNQGRSVVRPEHEQNRLSVQAIFRRLVAGAGGHGAVEETDLLQHPDRSPHLIFGQAEIRTVSQLAAVDGALSI
jgi:hypothetical protein